MVIGSGGREHAIAWRISKCSNLGKLYCLPGSGGTADIAENIPAGVCDFDLIAQHVTDKNIDLVVVGPEVPLVAGITDFLNERFPGLSVVGPTAKGAQLEGSKDFAKEFMMRHNIPTAAYRTFTKETLDDAYAFLETLRPPYVLKADGLAAGKGVVIPDNLEDARKELAEMFSGKFGDASARVVIEEYLSGIEVSVFVLTDGKDYLILPEAKDYKRIGVGDKGLNTGGMGAVSPVPFADSEFMAKVEQRIIKPTVSGLAEDGIDYRGFIFIGLMNCGGDPYVIEYNVRMGDPETEAVMTRIDSDLLSHLKAAAQGELASETMVINPQAAVTVVMVSGGYPEKYNSGYPIAGIENVRDAQVFHSGTKKSGDATLSAGGRVLAVTANAEDIVDARRKALGAVGCISFTDSYFRNDIANDVIALL